MRILLVSQMYPGPDAPELGTFVADLERQLAARGHEIARAVVDRRGGRSRHVVLARDVVVTGTAIPPRRRLRALPRPGGLARDARRPSSRRAHRARPGRRERRHVAGRARGDPASRYVARPRSSPSRTGCARRLEAAVPEARGRREVIDCGVDLERFAPGDADEARERARLAPGGHGVRLRRLAERAQERRPARAGVRSSRRGLARLRRRRPAPARSSRAGRASRSRGLLPTTSMPRWLQAADVVCQPSLVEPFGLATLEGLASARSVVATRSRRAARVRHRPTPECSSTRTTRMAIADALDAAAALPRPNLAARAAAASSTTSVVRSSGSRSLLRRAAGAPAATGAPVAEG